MTREPLTDEQAAAQRSVERAFPAVAEFLASDDAHLMRVDAPQVKEAATTDHLMDAPLDDLLAEFGVEVAFFLTSEREFTGATVVRGDGSLAFYLPTGRPDAEREIVVRSMLGQSLHVDMPDLPDPYQLSEFDGNGRPVVVNPAPRRHDHEGRWTR